MNEKLLSIADELDTITSKVEFIAWAIARTDDVPLEKDEAYGGARVVEAIGHRIKEISTDLGEIVSSKDQATAA